MRNRLTPFTTTPSTPVTVLIGLLLALLVSACSDQGNQTTADAAAADASEAQETAGAPAGQQAPDPALMRNLQAMQRQPGVTELDWRIPKERVAGASTPAELGAAAPFPAPKALAEAIAYHRDHSGLGLLVWRDGQLVGSDMAEGFSMEQHFSSFSMHKSVLALTILAAIEDGLMASLDDPVGRYINEWADLPEGEVTLRQLLTHTSAMEHFAMNGQSPKATNLVLSSKVSETALSYRLDGEPGTQFNYNNVNSQIAGVALERALARNGRRYADYLSSRLWQPLGNADGALWLEADNGSPRFYSSFEAGLADWLRIGIMILNGGVAGDTQVLSSQSLAELLQPTAVNPAYGLHLWLGKPWKAVRRYGPTTELTVSHEAPFRAEDVWFFDGFGGQRVYVVPSAKLVVARAGQVNLAYDDSIIINTLLKGLQEADISTVYETYNQSAANDTYAARFEQLLREARNGSGLAGYDPLIKLPGAEPATPLPRGTANWLDDETRGWLEQFGAGNNSSAIMIWHQGNVVYESYFGDGDPDSLIVTRSLSKPISIMAMGRALQLGYISDLDQPVDTYLHEWRDSDKSPMTLTHLLQMRSGLARQGNSMEPESFLNRAYLHPYHIEVILHEYPLTHPPGTRYDYSNANSELVAPIIERATGRRYEDWVGEAVFEPLGAAGGQIWVNRLGGTAHSGCCALVPPETILKLSVLVMNNGVWDGERLLPEGFVETITTSTEHNLHTGMGMYVAGPYVSNRGAANPDVPYGHTLHSEPYLDKDLYLFDGNGHQVSYHIPRHDLIVLRVGVRPPKDVTWDNTELPNKILRQYAAATGAELVPQPGPQAEADAAP